MVPTREQGRTAAGWLVAALFAFYICNISFFYHVHFIDGQAVAHSHIYGGGNSANPTHTHSHAQFLAIAALSVLLALGLVLATLARLFHPKVEQPVDPASHPRWDDFHGGDISRRGPPAVY